MAATFHGQLTLGQGALTKPGLCIADYANTAGLYASTTGIYGTKDVLYVGVGGQEKLKADSTGITVYALGVTNASALTTNCRLVTRDESNKSIGIMSAPSSNGQVLTGNTNGSLAWGTVPTGSGTQDTFAVWGANNSLHGSSLLRELYPIGLNPVVEANANVVVVIADGYVKTSNIDISAALVYRNVLNGEAVIPHLPQDTATGTMYSLSGNSGGLYVWRESFPLGGTPSGTPAGKVLKLKNALAVGAAPKISDLEWADDIYGTGGGGVGTVTSVAMTVPSVLFTTPVSGSPVTGDGTLALALTTQDANKFFGASDSGGPSLPAFRRILPIDLSATGTTNGFVLSRTGSTTMAWVAQTGGGGVSSVGVQTNSVPGITLAASPTTGSVLLQLTGSPLPKGPASSNGKVLKISGSVTVGADVPWANLVWGDDLQGSGGGGTITGGGSAHQLAVWSAATNIVGIVNNASTATFLRSGTGITLDPAFTAIAPGDLGTVSTVGFFLTRAGPTSMQWGQVFPVVNDPNPSQGGGGLFADQDRAEFMINVGWVKATSGGGGGLAAPTGDGIWVYVITTTPVAFSGWKKLVGQNLWQT